MITGNPIPGVSVYIISLDSHYPDVKRDTIAATSTDDNGYYEITFHGRREENITYYVSLIKQPEGYQGANDIRKKHSNHFSFNLKGSAYLKVHFKNAHPYDNLDHITIDAVLQFGNGVGTFDARGMNVDTNVLFSTRGQGNQFLFLSGFIIKNQITTVFLDSIFCSSPDTSMYNLFY
jgi:hypothetical protein